ncbi:MAG: hypothetical protein QOH71_1063 [Blastocatellia bacterium]|jgi:hypothetical protein|nr:hypothetical protein [Blastocatellia bacterium]
MSSMYLNSSVRLHRLGDDWVYQLGWRLCWGFVPTAGSYAFRLNEKGRVICV